MYLTARTGSLTRSLEKRRLDEGSGYIWQRRGNGYWAAGRVQWLLAAERHAALGFCIILATRACIKYGPSRTRFIAPARIIRFLVQPSTTRNGSGYPASRYISSRYQCVTCERVEAAVSLWRSYIRAAYKIYWQASTAVLVNCCCKNCDDCCVSGNASKSSIFRSCKIITFLYRLKFLITRHDKMLMSQYFPKYKNSTLVGNLLLILLTFFILIFLSALLRH